MRLRTLTVSSAAMALVLAGPIAPALAHEGDDNKVVRVATEVEAAGVGEGMTQVANLPYRTLTEGAASNGSDIEFMKLGSKEYALSGTLRQGMQIVDITNPAKPSIAGHYACPVNQGDVQVFRQGARVLATYTADSRINSAAGFAESPCVVEANKLGADIDGTEFGTFLVDVTNPRRPKTVSFLEVPSGSHNMTVHPSGKFLYNSNSDLLTARTTPFVTIFDISTPAKPKKVQEYRIPYVPLSLGSESHDITFNEKGDRAYFAALSQTLIVDTTNPADPKLVKQILDPSIQVVHGADPVTLKDKNGKDREFLIISDERAGAAAAAECPGGGLHVYDITDETAPAKVGAWFIDDIQPVASGSLPACTAHVMRIHEDQELMTVAWYIKGVRVIDLSELADAPRNPAAVAYGEGIGMKEVGSFVFPDSDTWSFKTNKIAADGSFFGYGNDMTRGLDVYRFEGLKDRTVAPLVPTDLLLDPVSAADEAGGLLPLEGTPGTGGLVALAALVALTANIALARRTRTGRLATA